MEAATLGAIASIVTVVAAAASTGVAVQQTMHQKRLADAAEEQRKNEARTAEETAAYNERQHRRKMAFLLGEQEAAFAAAGIDPNTGSPLSYGQDLVKQAELEALAIRREGTIVGGERRFEAGVAAASASGTGTRVGFEILGGAARGTSGGISSYRSVTTDWSRR